MNFSFFYGSTSIFNLQYFAFRFLNSLIKGLKYVKIDKLTWQAFVVIVNTASCIVSSRK